MLTKTSSELISGFLAEDISWEEHRGKIADAIRAEHPDFSHIVQTMDDNVTYCSYPKDSPAKYYKVSWYMKDGEVHLGDDYIELERKEVFVPKDT